MDPEKNGIELVWGFVPDSTFIENLPKGTCHLPGENGIFFVPFGPDTIKTLTMTCEE